MWYLPKFLALFFSLLFSAFSLQPLAFPSVSASQVYYANLHSHTTFSDGIGTPVQAYTYARDTAQIQVLALTEHNHPVGSSPGLDDSLYQRLRIIADSCTQDGFFVALAGQEVGYLNGFGHIAIFEGPQLAPRTYDKDLLGMYDWILKQGAPAEFCHPSLDDFNNLGYYSNYDKAIALLEILNKAVLYEDRYIHALNQGWHIGATAVQDNHQGYWGSEVNSEGKIPLTGILADSLTKGKILEALKNRRTFAMEVNPPDDRIMFDFTANGYEMGEQISTSRTVINFSVNLIAKTSFKNILLFHNGTIFDSLLVNNNLCSWQTKDFPAEGRHYYFVKAIQADGDRVWSSPIWIEVLPQVSEVCAWPNPVVDKSKIVYTRDSDEISSDIYIYDINGNLIWKKCNAGPEEIVEWSAQNSSGEKVANGLYLLLIEEKTSHGLERSLGKIAVKR
ncbi:MAG: CehA/McbA family metallohydrolase [Candidatus Edwardsbacteria bacterium]